MYSGYPVVNDPLYNHDVFGPNKGKGGDIGGKTDEQLVRDLINIHNAENWLGMDGDSDLSMFKPLKSPLDDTLVGNLVQKGKMQPENFYIYLNETSLQCRYHFCVLFFYCWFTAFVPETGQNRFIRALFQI